MGLSGDLGGEFRLDFDAVKAEDTERNPKPYRFPGFGGNGGGLSSELRVLPVSLRLAERAPPPENSC